MDTVTFPKMEIWDPGRRAVTFPAKIDGKEIRCEITYQALQDCYSREQGLPRPLMTFYVNRRFIEAKAESAIVNERFEPDGSVQISSGDCR